MPWPPQRHLWWLRGAARALAMAAQSRAQRAIDLVWPKAVRGTASDYCRTPRERPHPAPTVGGGYGCRGECSRL